jgi:hypothetical protein
MEAYKGSTCMRLTSCGNGEWRSIEVEVADAEPLVGMALLERNALNIAVKPGGAVSIEPLP